jgi:glycerophosphoryl diester phosphodiesterase
MKRIVKVGLGSALLIGVVSVLPGFPAPSHPYFANSVTGKVDILAHGAGQGVAPTNTLKAIEVALAQRADIVEVDVQLTADDVLVLHHDDTLDRTTDLTGPVAQKTWTQIAQEDQGALTRIGDQRFSGADTKVAPLREALLDFPEIRWNIEIKNAGIVGAEKLCQLIKDVGVQSQVLVASFHDEAMTHFRELCPSVATSMAPSEIRAFVIAAHMRLSRFVPTPAVAVQVPVAAGGFDLTNKRVVAALKARGIKLHYWTINDAAQMDDLIALGADGLLTDYVEVAMRVAQNAPTLSRP